MVPDVPDKKFRLQYREERYLMTLPTRPNRGGFLRPFGCGWFIREFLMGRAPQGSPTIDQEIGAC